MNVHLRRIVSGLVMNSLITSRLLYTLDTMIVLFTGTMLQTSNSTRPDEVCNLDDTL